MNDTLNIYNYDSPQLLLLDYFNERKSKNSAFSTRKWAKEMDLKSHSQLIFFLQGKRKVKHQHVSFLEKGLGLDSKEKLYFQSMIQYSNAKSLEEKNLSLYFLAKLHPQKELPNFEIKQHEIIANWIYPTILSVADLDIDPMTSETIYQLIKHRCTKNEVLAAVAKLLSAELLKENPDGTLFATYKKTSTKNDSADQAVQEYHQKVISLALDAVRDVPVEQREVQSYAMSVNPECLPKAKEMIRQFVDRVSQALDDGKSKQVYQFNVQLFPMSQAPSASISEKESKKIVSERYNNRSNNV